MLLSLTWVFLEREGWGGRRICCVLLVNNQARLINVRAEGAEHLLFQCFFRA